MAIDPGNPRRFLRSIKWKKAKDEWHSRAEMSAQIGRGLPGRIL